MKKLDDFDYRKAEADLDDIGDRHPDEIYSYHSEKAVRGSTGTPRSMQG